MKRFGATRRSAHGLEAIYNPIFSMPPRWKFGDSPADVPRSTLMYIEAEAKMDSFQAQDGTQRTALNLLQRKCKRSSAALDDSNIPKVTSRPSRDRASRAAARPAALRAILIPPTSRSAALVPPEEKALLYKKCNHIPGRFWTSTESGTG